MEPSANDRELAVGGGSPSTELDHVERNRVAWERWAPRHLTVGRAAWQDVDLRWGIWGVPESQLGILGAIEPGADVIELGCGTAEISAWLARRSARPVAIDIAEKQLRNAEELQREFDVAFPLIRANAEHVQFDSASFDVAVSEYGASLWCDPQRWLSEAYRLLRPNGTLLFFTNSPLLMICTPESGGFAEEQLVRDYFSRPRIEFGDDGPVEFHLAHGEWIQLLHAIGFSLENLIEVRPSSDSRARYNFATVEWARRWPSEDIWIARKNA